MTEKEKLKSKINERIENRLYFLNKLEKMAKEENADDEDLWHERQQELKSIQRRINLIFEEFGVMEEENDYDEYQGTGPI
jgi:hypothetical protein